MDIGVIVVVIATVKQCSAVAPVKSVGLFQANKHSTTMETDNLKNL